MNCYRTFVALIGIAAACMAVSSCQDNQKSTTMSDQNPVIENMMARRSIRQYQPQPVEREKMEVILNCGINAPNGQNKQSWEIRVVDDPAQMDAIIEAMAKANPEVDPAAMRSCYRGAPTMVFIANDLSYDFSQVDCGLLAENMMLSAWSLGVGSICLGSPVRFINRIPATDPVMQLLDFSPGYRLLLCVGFGYADESPAAKPRNPEKIKFL